METGDVKDGSILKRWQVSQVLLSFISMAIKKLNITVWLPLSNSSLLVLQYIFSLAKQNILLFCCYIYSLHS